MKNILFLLLTFLLIVPNVYGFEYRIGTSYERIDPELSAIRDLNSDENKLPYYTGPGTANLADLTSFARTILDDADAAAVRSTIGGQPLESTLTDIADGTIAENLVNTANPWADNEVANDLTLDLLNLSARSSAPGTPVSFKIYLADNDNWDPCDIAGTDDYYVVYTGSEYRAFLKGDGSIPVSSVELPSYAHWATADAKYNDTSTPHVLTVEEVKNGLITNAGAAEDKVYTFPAAEMGFNGMGMVVAAYQMDFEPHSGEAFWLNGTQMAVDEHIQNTADTKGDVISFWSVETGDGTYEIFFKSDNSNWVEASP